MPNDIKKSLNDVAVLLIMKPARTERGRKVHAAVLARIEIAIAIEAALNA